MELSEILKGRVTCLWIGIWLIDRRPSQLPLEQSGPRGLHQAFQPPRFEGEHRLGKVSKTSLGV